jgi:hypothetical protein
MLYFSESGWAPPDSLEVSEAFDRDYDREEYEQKIGAVVRSFLIYARDKDRSSLDRWKDAVRTLKAEDHYLLVLIDPSQNPQTATKSSLIKLFGMGLVLACLALEIIYVLVNR